MMVKPKWLKTKAPDPVVLDNMEKLFNQLTLETVCKNAHCPNLGECFKEKTATFMILGNVCSRRCTFCAVDKGQPTGVDSLEPWNLAEAVKQLQLQHVVVTSVTRDDLPDGGAGHYFQVIKALRQVVPETSVEVLIPDFQGSREALQIVIAAKPDIINHNIETVPRLYPAVRPLASYENSLRLLQEVKKQAPEIRTKSGLMVGLGEEVEELLGVFRDLRNMGCDNLTVGQYLQPSPKHLLVVEYITPEQFAFFEQEALAMGFGHVAAGPFVRSSYKAAEAMKATGRVPVC